MQVLSRPDWVSELSELESPGVLETLAEMMGVSRFLWEDYLRMQHDNLFPVLLDRRTLDRGRTRVELDAAVEEAVNSSARWDDRVRALNDFKDREMFRIDLRYITGRTGSRDFARELTSLAEVVVARAFELGIESVRKDHGTPRHSDGTTCPWSIFALGKFGARDMGFGSDLELLFVYEAEGATDGTNSIRTSTFFEEAVKQFLGIVETRQQGIFEIDMRLRPYGAKGPLASSLSAVGHYYSPAGDSRQFERLALVRLRPVAGDADLARHVTSIQEAFVYSAERLDMEDVLHLRRRQASELVERGSLNVKLSPGGVVDLEYFVQCWQIVCGRTDLDVRGPNTPDAVRALGRKGYLAEDLADRISETYAFLRRLIDSLRVVGGSAKDLELPSPDTRAFHYLAHRLDVEPPEGLSSLVAESMEFSQELWLSRSPPE